jgi:hypothetical protein
MRSPLKSYAAMAKQLDERITDAEAYRNACERYPYRYPERGQTLRVNSNLPLTGALTLCRYFC